jgi:hypothetical protein
VTAKTPLIALIVLLNLVRFIGLESSPPGFDIDEAAGAAHVICLQQTGRDFDHQSYPLFSAGLGGGFYTPAFLYGEYGWTSIFGHTVQAFRSFSAAATALTVLFLCLWAGGRESDTNGDAAGFALWVGLSASVMPWAFQFSRIAWDPPLAVLFLVMALWASGLRRGLANKICPGVFLALAAYSYPPMRVMVVVFWLLLPERTWRSKLSDLGLFAVACIPLVFRSLDASFTARGNWLLLWSDDPANPYANADLWNLGRGFVHQMLQHLSLPFLFLRGDANLRHSTGTTGMLSWLDAVAWVGGIVLLARWLIDRRPRGATQSKGILLVATSGALLGIVPAAVTWEGVPHALRAIAAWPFLALFSGHCLARVEQHLRQRRAQLGAVWVGGATVVALIFFAFYLNGFFGEYRRTAAPWFRTGGSPLAEAYQAMTVYRQPCSMLSN